MRTRTIYSIAHTISFLFIQSYITAQVINWENVSRDSKHQLHINAGAEYGLTTGAGYHHLLFRKNKPLWIGGEISVPGGNRFADDFKIRVGGQARIAGFHHWMFSVRVQAITRRFQNQSVRLLNFGSDFAVTAGYYRRYWFFGAAAGFDKAIVTHFKHSDWYKTNIYRNVQDGWYEPATGGNFYSVLEGGYSVKKIDFTCKAGTILQQDFASKPTLPFIGQLGVNIVF